ncbi:MAG: hypothetical protein ACLQUY_13600 [Ktedonobacterales bacterium]
MSLSSKATSSGSNGAALTSFRAGIVSPVAIALDWLITYSPLTLEAYPTLQTILVLTLVAISAIAGLTALVTGIIALVRARRYPGGEASIGYAIAGVILGALEVIVYILVAIGLFLLATRPF